MKLESHITLIEIQCDEIEGDSHLERCPDVFVALEDVKAAVARLKEAARQSKNKLRTD